ncbi:MAG: phosphoribosylglycinamide formyltransferase [Deltaproteobacteria bacterium]|nr:phosphoribosylglycinamide formyltransferase [Deltaproteobacteria bacterium]
MTPKSPILRLAVFVSGSGSNLQSILDACAQADFPAEVACVFCNRSDAYGLARARDAGVASLVVDDRDFPSRRAHEEVLLKGLADRPVDLVVLAGYMRILTPLFLQAFRRADGRSGVINIHPADTRDYQGAHGYEYALGIKPHGLNRLEKTKITVHWVDDGVDTGPIIAQADVPVLPEDDLRALKARGLEIEHQLYPEVIRDIAMGRYD